LRTSASKFADVVVASSLRGENSVVRFISLTLSSGEVLPLVILSVASSMSEEEAPSDFRCARLEN